MALQNLLGYVHRFPRENTFYAVSFIKALMCGDIESCLERTRSFFASISNDLDNKTEKHYQTVPDEALAQIDSKQYALPYQADGRRIIKAGVNFDGATRTIGEWKIS